MSTESEPDGLLRVSGLAAGYGDTPVVSDVDLAVHAGQIACLIGPNGAGKSTLLKAIAGAAATFCGSVTLGAVCLDKLAGHERTRTGLGYVPQTSDVFGSLTVLENLEMGGYVLPKAMVKGRIAEVLERFPPLATKQRRVAETLSGGERKMLGIARSLMSDPSVLLLDEPTANLSYQLSTDLLEGHIRSLASGGTAVLIVEQKARAALASSDWAFVMVGGRICFSNESYAIHEDDDLGRLFLSGHLEENA